MVRLWSAESLQSARDPDVLLVSPLISFKLLALDHLEPARRRLRFGGARLVLRVVSALPRQPVGGPLGVCRQNAIGSEGKSRAGCAIECSECVRKQRTQRASERLPGEQRARIVLNAGDRRRKRSRDCQRLCASGFFTAPTQF